MSVVNQKELKKFSLTLFIGFLAVGLIMYLRHDPLYYYPCGIALFIILLGGAAPVCLVPVHWLWMRLARILGWTNTCLILFVLFYLIFTPLGLIIKLFGKDLLDRKIDKARVSYWIKKDKIEFNPLNYERQF